MLRCWLYLVLASTLFVSNSYAATAPERTPLPLKAPLQDKNFYLLSVMQQSPALRGVLMRDAALRQIGADRAARLAACADNASCKVNALKWSDDDVRRVSAALTQIYLHEPALRDAVNGPLRASGSYELYAQEDGEKLLVDAWTLCARGLNEILSMYGGGDSPRYPKIDSVSVDIHSVDFQKNLDSWMHKFASGKPRLFFESSLNVALRLLALNHRDEAARFEPMEAGVNQSAYSALRNVRWQDYPYSVIVVPGEGPEDPKVTLDPMGRKRVELAVQAYHEGKAPLILVTGGYVHPEQTQYAEAMEMKKALLHDYGVPESAVLVDPHARHTTTNLRNAVREIYRYNMPMDRPALIVSDRGQIGYIRDHRFVTRCMDELGYLPFQNLTTVSDTRLSFLPNIDSLEQNPVDPLDP